MASPSASVQRSRVLRRDSEHAVIAGVAAGIARHIGRDPLLVRIAFLVATVAWGIGVVVYALAWILIPAEDGARAARGRLLADRRGVEVALGVGFLVLGILLCFRAVGFWLSDAVVWPVVLLAAGGAVIWRQSQSEGRRPEAPTSPPKADRCAAELPERAEAASAIRERTAVVSWTGIGVALVIAACLVFLQTTDSLSTARDVVLATLVVTIALAVIFAPWILRLVRSLATERAERIRSQERAEMAAHLHDSVLQTLALMQRRIDHPTEVAALARRQERELRSWLSGSSPRSAVDGKRAGLTAALESVADDVERTLRVPVEVVVVGDAELDDSGEALVAAAREAVVNAAKFGAGSPVSVYAEASGGRMQVFVRDRGPGFDPSAVPTDRRGVRESIVGRMARNGGHALIHSSPGEGTEVELVLDKSRQ